MTHGNQRDKHDCLVLSSSGRKAALFASSWISNHALAVTKRALFALALMLFGLVSGAVAQSAATLDGIVQDPTGAVIPKASVELKNTATGELRVTKSNGVGIFSFSSVQTGDYVLRVDVKGFQSTEVTGIHLDPGDQRTLRDIKLSVIAGASESVTVTSEEGKVSTDSGETSTLISSDDIDHLAIEGRDVTELLKTLPGMAIVQSNSSYSNSAYDPSLVAFTGAIGSYAANGTQTNSTALLSDGMDITDPGSYGIAIQNVNYDHVAEVKVQTGSFTADSAHGPVVVNAIGKSGGDTYHGSVYAYGRTHQLNSLDWIAKYTGQPSPQDRQIYPGFTVGGPLRIPGLKFTENKKLLFFLGAEEYAQRKVYAYNSASTATVSELVPTVNMRKGIFSAYEISQYLGANAAYNAGTDTVACTGTNPYTNTADSLYANVCKVPTQGPQGVTDPITGGDISSYIDPLGQLILDAMPVPNIANTNGYNFITTDFVNNNLVQVHSRVDYIKSENEKIFLTYGIESGKQYQPASPYGRTSPNGMGGAIDTPGGGFFDTVTSDVASLAITSILSSTLTNEFYAGGAYFSQPFTMRNPSAVEGNPYQFVFNNGSKAIPSWQTWNSSSYDGLPMASIEDPTWSSTSSYTKKQMRLGGDNITKLLGKHTLRAGIFYQWVGNPQMQQGQHTNGTISDYYHPSSFADADKTTVYTTGNYLADNLEGIIGNISQANTKIETNLYFYDLSGYLQDHWLPGKHLSIDLGIRLEHSTPWNDPHGVGVAIFDPTAYASGAPVASPGVLYHAIDSGIPLSGVPTRSVFPEPRVGFAYDIRGNSKTILRGGYGVYRQHDSYNDGLASAQTAQGQRTYATSGTSGRTFQKLNMLQSQATSSAGFTVDSTIYTRMAGDDEMPRVQTYNLVLDQRLPHNVGVEVGYVGNYADHLMESSSLSNINAMPMGALFKAQPNSGRTDTAATNGTIFPFFSTTLATNTTISALDTAHLDSFRPYPLYNDIYAIRHRGYSNYNGLQTMFFWKPRHGSINANYTFAKALGVVSGPDPINLGNDYRPLSMDRRHILNITYSYSFGKLVQGRLLGLAANGWEVSGVTGMQGGTILTSLMSSDLGLSGSIIVPSGTVANMPDGSSSTCPSTTTITSCSVLVSSTNITGSPDYTLQPTLAGDAKGKVNHQYVDGSVFRLPTIGSNGPTNLGSLRGPLFFNSDLTLSKQFKVRRNGQLQFRVAAFNFLNRANYTFSSLAPGAYSLNFSQTDTGLDMNQDFSDATNQQAGFGSTSIRTGRRIMEVSLKYKF